jgi:outer membrane murein-binding lipoprotein Lpp
MASGNWIAAVCTAALTSLLLAGCATPLSESECRTADWQKIGEYDGNVLGLRARIDQLAYQCKAYGVEVNEAQYMAGWQYGYAEYQRRMVGSECCR